MGREEEDVRQRPPLHCSLCFCLCLGGLKWHSNQNAADEWLTGVFFKSEDASFIEGASFSINCKAHGTEATRSRDEKTHYQFLLSIAAKTPQAHLAVAVSGEEQSLLLSPGA